MNLDAAQIAKQKALLAAVETAFNGGVVPIGPQLRALLKTQPNPVLQGAVDAWNAVAPAFNVATPQLRAAITATDLLAANDDTSTSTPPLFSNDLSSDAVIQRDFWHANAFYNPGPSLPTVNNPSKWVDGMLEVPITPGLNASPGQGGTGASWHWNVPGTPNELWLEYDFYIGPDVLIGFAEEGCKLPGLSGAWEQAGQWAAGDVYGWFSIRMWHRRPDAAGNMELAAYAYSARNQDAKKTYGEILATGKMLKAGVKYRIGQHIKLNTQAADGSWNADGIVELLLDGATVWSDKAFKVRGDARATFQELFFNVFHGGSIPPTASIHYRFGRVVVDTKPPSSSVAQPVITPPVITPPVITPPVITPPVITPPVITQGAVPAWRRGLPVGVWSDILGTAPAITLPGLQTFFDASYSGQANDRVNGVVYLAGSAGHQVSDDNHVFMVNLMQDAPKWVMLRASDGARSGTDNAAYFPNGNPTGCHLYYSGQVVQVNGKPVVVRTLNLAGSYTSSATPLHTDAFHPDTNGWDLNGGDWDILQTQYKELATALDARTGRIYVQDQGGLTAALDTRTRKWSQGFVGNGWGYGWGGMVVVPALDEVIYDFGGYRKGGDFFEGLHLTRNVRITHPYTWSGTRMASPAQVRAMIVQERNNAIFVVSAGNDPAFFNRLDLQTWTMANVGTIPQPTTIYNRIEDFPGLGGIAHFPSHASNMRFFPTE